jgi:hypothetical protein
VEFPCCVILFDVRNGFIKYIRAYPQTLTWASLLKVDARSLPGYSQEACDRVRKTKAGKIVLGVINIAFIIVLITAVYSAIPPAYNVGISPPTATPTSSGQTITVTYTVTNHGFYRIDNFYVQLLVANPSGQTVGNVQTVSTSIQTGSSVTGTISLDLTQSSISANPGNYAISVVINSEFAYGLIKFSVNAPQVISLS